VFASIKVLAIKFSPIKIVVIHFKKIIYYKGVSLDVRNKKKNTFLWIVGNNQSDTEFSV